MADADEPWIREWINSVADDMMREHSYMEVSLRGSELIMATKNLVADCIDCRPPRFGFLQDAILCVKFLSEELLGFGNFAIPLAQLFRS